MSNCSNHRKDLHGETDMKHLAEEVGNLHYESLSTFLYYLSEKVYQDGRKDFCAGRYKLAEHLFEAQKTLHRAHQKIDQAFKICAPFMEQSTNEKDK